MFCSHCGAEVNDNAEICSNCGCSVKATPKVGGKSKIAAALLAFFLGTLGIHNFYLGFKGKGLAQLLISILTLGFGTIVTGIWAFVEFIMILVKSDYKDSDGNLLA